MKRNGDIDIIREVIKRNISEIGEYNLFLIKSSFFRSDSYDIGIDCSFVLNPMQKVMITEEINKKIRNNNLFLIDFSRISSDLKESIYEKCELIS